jgi:hypothetical protein
VQNLNNEIHANVKIGKHLFSEFKDNKGLRLGDAFAPLLFSIALETAIRLTKVETQRNTCGKCSQIMAYASDVVFMGRILKDIEEVFTSLVKHTNKMGLQINEKKDKIYYSITKALQCK